MASKKQQKKDTAALEVDLSQFDVTALAIPPISQEKDHTHEAKNKRDRDDFLDDVTESTTPDVLDDPLGDEFEDEFEDDFDLDDTPSEKE